MGLPAELFGGRVVRRGGGNFPMQWQGFSVQMANSRRFMHKTPSLPILVDLANALHISVDALLVDSLGYSLSSSDSDLHRLLLDCNETEQEIIIRTARELKATLVSLGIQHPSVLKSQNKKARISRRRTLESTWVLSVVYSSFSYNSFSVF